MGSMKMIVLEDDGENKIPNTVIKTKIYGSLVPVCTTNSAGICYSVAPFGNNTLVITDKNANNTERSVVVDFQDSTSSENVSFVAPLTMILNLTTTVDGINVLVVNTKNETLCNGVVEKM